MRGEDSSSPSLFSLLHFSGILPPSSIDSILWSIIVLWRKFFLTTYYECYGLAYIKCIKVFSQLGKKSFEGLYGTSYEREYVWVTRFSMSVTHITWNILYYIFLILNKEICSEGPVDFWKWWSLLGLYECFNTLSNYHCGTNIV